MFDIPFANLVPKPALAACLAWGLAHYFVAGPAIGARIAEVDHLAACEAGLEAMMLEDAGRRAEALPPPASDPGRDIAAEQLRRLSSDPMVRELMKLGGFGDLLGLSARTDRLLDDYETGKAATKDAYDRSLERLREETAASLAATGSACGCLADAAIAGTRMEWAIFTGTLGLVQPSPLRDFGDRMTEVWREGRCHPAAQVSP